MQTGYIVESIHLSIELSRIIELILKNNEMKWIVKYTQKSS